MAVSDDSLTTSWERHLANIQENIDQYISSHYQPPYVEHDLDLEDDCDEDEYLRLAPRIPVNCWIEKVLSIRMLICVLTIQA